MLLSPGVACSRCRHVLRQHLKFARFQPVRRTHDRSTVPESWYWDTLPPTPRQLAAAEWFFANHPARRLWSANEWRKQNQDTSGTLTPEIAFLGRSNVGKSSLLNALLGNPALNPVGSTPGKTKLMSAYGLSPTDPKTGGALRGWKGSTETRVMLLDSPGYGFRSQRDWGAEIIKYFKWRKQLRRVFILLDAQVGLKKNDTDMLKMLRDYGISHQLIATKADKIGGPQKREAVLQKTLEAMQDAAQPSDGTRTLTALGEIIVTGSLGDGKSNKNVKPSQFLGLNEVRWSVLRAAGLDDFATTAYNKLPESQKYDDTPIAPNAISRSRKQRQAPKDSPALQDSESWSPMQHQSSSIPADSYMRLSQSARDTLEMASQKYPAP